MGIMKSLGLGGNDESEGRAAVPTIEPPPAPPLSLLTSRHEAERRTARKVREAEISSELEAGVRAAQKAESDARGRARRARDEMAATLDEHEEALDAALVADFRAALMPLAKSFADGPRSTARAFAAAYRDFAARAQEELGRPISDLALVALFASAAGVERRALGPSLFVGLAEAAALRKAIEASAADVLVESAMRALEVAIAQGVLGRQDQDGRWADAIAAYATHARITMAMDGARDERRKGARFPMLTDSAPVAVVGGTR